MMSLSQAAQVLNGRVVGDDVRFTAVSSDSRKLTQGDLFVALRGEKFDGYEFVPQAAQAGAAASLVNADSYKAHPSVISPQSSILVLLWGRSVSICEGALSRLATRLVGVWVWVIV